MTVDGADPTPERFLVELDPSAGGCEPELLTARARQAARAAGVESAIRHVRTIYVPEDGRTYLLVEGPSPGDVERALRAVGIDPRSNRPTIRATVRDGHALDAGGGSS